MLIYLTWMWERSVECELDSCCNFSTNPSLYLFEDLRIDPVLLDQPRAEELEWVALGHPLLFFFFRAIVRALNIAYVVTVVAIGVAENEGRTLTPTWSLH